MRSNRSSVHASYDDSPLASVMGEFLWTIGSKKKPCESQLMKDLTSLELLVMIVQPRMILFSSNKINQAFWSCHSTRRYLPAVPVRNSPTHTYPITRNKCRLKHNWISFLS